MLAKYFKDEFGLNFLRVYIPRYSSYFQKLLYIFLSFGGLPFPISLDVWPLTLRPERGSWSSMKETLAWRVGFRSGASKSSQWIVWLVVTGRYWGDESLEWLINDGYIIVVNRC